MKYTTDFGTIRLPAGAVEVLLKTPRRKDGSPDQRYSLGRAFRRYERQLGAWAAERFHRSEPLVDPPSPSYRIADDEWRAKVRASIVRAFHAG
jgi:hypothetical protein